MSKIKNTHRILALVLAVLLMFTVVQTTSLNPAQAASTASSVNLLKHSTFEETDVDLGPHTPTKLDNWHQWLTSSEKVNHDAYSGQWALRMGGMEDSIEQDVANLKVGATYKVSVWAKNTNPSGTVAWFGIKNFTTDGSEKKLQITSTEYQKYEMEFTYTGSPGTVDADRYPRAYVWVERSSSGYVYMDDFSMTVVSDLESVSIEDGKITAQYNPEFTGTPSKGDFTVTYTTSAQPDEIKSLAITGESVNDKTLELYFAPMDKLPVEQLITANVTYKPKNQTLTVDYTLEASGEAIVETEVVDFTSINGSATATLAAVPTVAPKAEDFTLEYKVDGGDYQAAAIQNFIYDPEQKTVTFTFDAVSSSDTAKQVTMRLINKGISHTATFTVEVGDGVFYYVDATNGSDANLGTSPDAPWKTIDKVNEQQFQPGDRILFKAGETWTGALKPQGSGVEGKPIIISSYGVGPKPILKPGQSWTIPYMCTNKNYINSPTVNNGITFINQEYWEVSNLELWDPSYLNNESTSVYRRGINITAEDVGDIRHFYFDNLTIHGFRGPNSNEGKSSGGIIMTVMTSKNVSERVPTAIHDIRVTNCEMYKLGRSGINFITPWTTREGAKWSKYAPFGYTGQGAWKPYENFVLRNNIIHDIDGDGAIIDNCKNAVIENNTVYRCVYNSWFAVGMFNWNSDNTVFQFNEIYDCLPADAKLSAGDGQGIEIDAINDGTLVQYNYMHDNNGGIFMWCSTLDLRGFDGIFRYNISQNDRTKNGVIDWRPGHEGSMCYNNTIYLGEGVDRSFINIGQNPEKSSAKIYNNIFMNEGNMAKPDGFLEDVMDYQNNIFYGFPEIPSNESNMAADPMFIAPNTGATGRETVEGYYLQTGSPAIDAGVNIDNNGGRDYFGRQLTDGKPDIGAAEYVAPSEGATVNSVEINPQTAAVKQGAMQQFAAIVDASEPAAKAVTWKVEGSTNPGTTISSSGLLSVAEDEAATNLTVIATSVVDPSKSDSIAVTVEEKEVVDPYKERNLALDCTILGSSTLQNASVSERPQKAFDDNETTKWCPGSDQITAWMAIDLGSEKKINRWEIVHAGEQEGASRNTRDFALQVLKDPNATPGQLADSSYLANDGNWTTVKEYTDNTQNVTSWTFEEPVVGRVFRLNVTKGDGSAQWLSTRIYEWRMIGVDAGAQQTYDISIEEMENGSITASKSTAAEGDTVTLTVNPADGYRLVENSLKANGTIVTAVDGVYTFIMPGEAVTVTAQFEQVPQVDKSNLLDKINAAKAIEQGNYTDETYQALQNAIAAAEGVYNQPDATQGQVNAQIDALQEAIDGLTEAEVYTATITGLVKDSNSNPVAGATVTLSAQARELTMSVTTDSLGRYTFDDVPVGSYVVSVDMNGYKRYSFAVQVTEGSDIITLDDIQLEPKPANVVLEVLKQVIANAERIQSEGALNHTVQVVVDGFTASLKAAKELVANGSDSQQEVNNATMDLLGWIAKVDWKQGDKTALEITVDIARTINENINLYLDTDVFTAALSKAEEVLASGNAMQDDVDDAYNALLNAMMDLKMKPNKDILKKMVENGPSDLTIYTPESVQKYKDTLARAKAVLNDESATQDQVDAAAEALKAAEDGLVVSAKVPGSNGSTGETQPAGDGSAPTKTGDAGSLSMASAIVLGGIAVLVMKKKRQG